MGVPNVTQVHAWTDRIAALVKADLAGFDSELVGAAAASLWGQVALSADPAVLDSLLASSLNLDEMSLPENYSAALAVLARRTPYQDWVNRLAGLVTSAAGGSYASLAAYLVDKSATVHPLFGEVVRAGFLGEGGLTDANGVLTCFAPNYQSRAPDKVYTGADGALVDDTTDAASAATADVALFATNGHALYVGSRYKFSQMVVALSTLANVTIAPTFQYWNGNAWVALTVTDNAVGFTRNDTVKFTPPADWERCAKDAGGTAFAETTPRYYIRIARTAGTLVTPPVATCVRIIPVVVPTVPGGSIHLGVDQPPLALCRITGVDTLVVEVLNAPQLSRFKAPAVRARALTPLGSDLTLTLRYTDQAANADLKAQSAWTAPAALDTVALTLNTGDTGVQAILDTTSVSTNNTAGVVEIYVVESRVPAL